MRCNIVSNQFWLLCGVKTCCKDYLLLQLVERLCLEMRYDFVSKQVLTLILGCCVMCKVNTDSIVFYII